MQATTPPPDGNQIDVAPPPAFSQAEVRLSYRMRRWWLDRYTLEQIRELGACLLELPRTP